MAKIEIGKGLKNTLQGVAGTVKSTVSTVKDVKLPDVKLPDVKLPEVKLPEVKAPEQMKDLFKKKDKAAAEDASQAQAVKALSARAALKAMYYLMAVDGEVFHGEEEKFDSIGAAIAPSFGDIRKQVIEECNRQMEKAVDPDDRYDVIQDGVGDAIAVGAAALEASIPPKLLVWNMLAVAYSDEHYDEPERKLVKYVVRKLDIDKAVFLEMESSFLTLMDLEKELGWIKTTDRPYMTIEAMVNEIADRKNAIIESVKDLIVL
ncbi:MAG: TerB family tellurite resistance protein [Lachnospiraceae bacterium]|jgi:uncharacterized tellurite resistance protein B-like protein|nr:TerB family tellurite resistance protein [Lachnospiraceae bacterium]